MNRIATLLLPRPGLVCHDYPSQSAIGLRRHKMPEMRLLSSFTAYREDPFLFAATLVAAVTSIAALLLHLAGIIRMPYTLSFLTAPGMILILCIQIWAGRSGRTVLVNRIRVGFAAGIVALVAYNATRWVCGVLLSLST